MSHKLKILHIVTGLSLILYIGIGLLFCGINNECTDAGLVIAPLLIPSFLLVPITVIIDLVVLGRKLAPSHKRGISGMILFMIVAILILAYVVFDHRQYYPSDKALSLVRNCGVSYVSYDDGDAVYFYPTVSINGKDQLKVHESEHARFLQTLKDSAHTCKYDLQSDSNGFQASNP
jgi:hypothetical protein